MEMAVAVDNEITSGLLAKKTAKKMVEGVAVAKEHLVLANLVDEMRIKVPVVENKGKRFIAFANRAIFIITSEAYWVALDVKADSLVSVLLIVVSSNFVVPIITNCINLLIENNGALDVLFEVGGRLIHREEIDEGLFSGDRGEVQENVALTMPVAKEVPSDGHEKISTKSWGIKKDWNFSPTGLSWLSGELCS